MYSIKCSNREASPMSSFTANNSVVIADYGCAFQLREERKKNCERRDYDKFEY